MTQALTELSDRELLEAVKGVVPGAFDWPVVEELWKRYEALKKDRENPYRGNRGKTK